MIESITIKNFQSHLDNKIEFSPSITSIVGKSNTGKTACIRALRLIKDNRPLGFEFVHHGTKFSEITINKTQNGKKCSIYRKRGKNNNDYVINEDFDHPLTAFGTTPPAQVNEILNLDDINLQGQFSPYFLVFNSPGDVATYIRSLTGLDEIDKVVDEISKRSNSAENDTKIKRAALQSIENDLVELNKVDLVKLSNLINESELLIIKNKTILEKETKLIQIIKQIAELDKGAINLPDNVGSLIGNATTLVETHYNALNKRNNLSNVINKLNQIKPISIDKNRANELSEESNRIYGLYNINKERLSKLLGIVESISNINEKVKQYGDGLVKLMNIKMELIQQLTVCPISGEPLSEKCKNGLLGNQ